MVAESIHGQVIASAAINKRAFQWCEVVLEIYSRTLVSLVIPSSLQQIPNYPISTNRQPGPPCRASSGSNHLGQDPIGHSGLASC
jgi:hypothetical protein